MDVFTLVMIVTLASGEESRETFRYYSLESCQQMARRMRQENPRIKSAHCQRPFLNDTLLAPKRDG
jgi:hypothetical protein